MLFDPGRKMRYRMRKVDFTDLARTVAYTVEDTEALVNSTVAVFSESKYGPAARRLALAERNRLNREAEGR